MSARRAIVLTMLVGLAAATTTLVVQLLTDVPLETSAAGGMSLAGAVFFVLRSRFARLG